MQRCAFRRGLAKPPVRARAPPYGQLESCFPPARPPSTTRRWRRRLLQPGSLCCPASSSGGGGGGGAAAAGGGAVPACSHCRHLSTFRALVAAGPGGSEGAGGDAAGAPPQLLRLQQFAELGQLPNAPQDGSDVEVEVLYSTLNYKDAMVLGGRSGVTRGWPIVPGIDLAGRVLRTHSDHAGAPQCRGPLSHTRLRLHNIYVRLRSCRRPAVAGAIPSLSGGFLGWRVCVEASQFSPGDEVVVTGQKLGQHVDGALSERLLLVRGPRPAPPTAHYLVCTQLCGDSARRG
jgi:hypothetical protein